MDQLIEVMPKGFRLREYEACGSPERFEHIDQQRPGLFSQDDVDGDENARTVVLGTDEVVARFRLSAPKAAHVVALTFSCERFATRIVDVLAGSNLLLAEHTLHAGHVERLLLRVPASAVEEGSLNVAVHRIAGPDVAVSAVELWSDDQSPARLRIGNLMTLYGDVQGVVRDLMFRPVAGASVSLLSSGSQVASCTVDAEGRFRFERSIVDAASEDHGVVIRARSHEHEGEVTVSEEELAFAPVRYTPMPSQCGNEPTPRVSLDGRWLINPAQTVEIEEPGSPDTSWRPFQVPGQWAQQGFDFGPEAVVQLAREFDVPESWRSSRAILRFEAVHGGARYWLNGTYLGRSENLFTPVDWDVSACIAPGEKNLLVASVTTNTRSERLSYASGYAFHDLGGIHRTVALYALPRFFISTLHVASGLEAATEDGYVEVSMQVDDASGPLPKGMSCRLSMCEDDAKEVASQANPVSATAGILRYRLEVPAPAKWTAETPALYTLVIDLLVDGVSTERIERKIGFRTVEVRGSQLYVNGKVVKLAGACHHEVDPLTGRAATARHAERDITLMKGANLNYLRTSHYPPTKELVEAADRLGMYVEVEAPLCWVRNRETGTPLREVLEPTSAMVDYYHAHPSVIVWSLANESYFHRFFDVANRLVKDLDPTRPTTFNDPDPRRICDIANLHYPPMPYDDVKAEDPRPVFLGEYFYPLCHEQTDMRVDPGLRELWGHGHADPDSSWARFCAKSFDGTFAHAGTAPGAWDHILQSRRVIGGAIWALIDEPFYLPKDAKAGYAWVHGYWGLIDAWRRPKPEWWLAKQIFSPVRFRRRILSREKGGIHLPIENRYSFLSLSHLTFNWKLNGTEGSFRSDIGPSETEDIYIPVSTDVSAGDRLIISAVDSVGNIVTQREFPIEHDRRNLVPKPESGCPEVTENGTQFTIQGDSFRIESDEQGTYFCLASLDGNPRVLCFPRLHLTRIDLADLVHPRAAPYAVFPALESRVVTQTNVYRRPSFAEITVTDCYSDFSGTVTMRVDRRGITSVDYDYRYTGRELKAREVGIVIDVDEAYDCLRWDRWSEWGAFPDTEIGRCIGVAGARRSPDYGPGRENAKPSWPWALDQTDLGTNDFRSIKFNVYNAQLESDDGRVGVRVLADGDAHVRSSLDPASNTIALHLLSECRMGPRVIHKGDRVAGSFTLDFS